MSNFIQDRGLDLLAPRKNIWPVDPEKIQKLADDILGVLSEEWQQRFVEFCLACYLMEPNTTPQPVLSWLESEFGRHGQNFPVMWDELRAWNWGVLPLPALDRQRNGVLRYALLGVIDSKTTKAVRHFSPGFEQDFNSEAQLAVTTAIDLLHQNCPNASCVIWPFLYPDATVHQIEQGSIGLPFFLALNSLCKDGTLPAVLATGCLKKDGSLKCVAGLKQKYNLVKSAGCCAFIYPKIDGFDPLTSEPIVHGERFPVASIQKAILFWNCYNPNTGSSIKDYIDNIERPQRLLKYLHEIPDAMIPLPPELFNQLQKSISRFITDSPATACQSLAEFAGSLERAIATDNKIARVRVLMQLFTPDLVAILGKNDPKIGFRLSQLQLFVANRSGLVTDDFAWEKLSSSFREAKSTHDYEDDRHAIIHAINSFIPSHHNAFKFSIPDIEQFLQNIQDAHVELEEQFLRKRQRNINQTDGTLGALYGIIAQHYAYCGLSREALAYSDKALDAFGFSTTSPLTKDCRQQLTYRVYIHLGSRDISAARNTLCSLLEISNLTDFNPDSCTDEYHHAAIARYLADSGDRMDRYHHWAIDQFPAIKKRDHPWQLWSYNIARLVTSPTEKNNFLRTSLDICSRPGSPPIQVMSLLSLAELWEEKLMSEPELMAGVHSVLEVIASGKLDVNHFSNLLEKQWQDVLEYVKTNKGNLFPFNYY